MSQDRAEAPQPPPAALRPRRSRIGVIGLVASLVAFVLTPIFSANAGSALFVGYFGPPITDEEWNAMVWEQIAEAVPLLLAHVIPAILGITGLLCGIKALRTTSRKSGIVAIAIAVLLPVIYVFVFFWAQSRISA